LEKLEVNVKLVIFDLDGTLLESSTQIYQSVVLARQKLGLKVVPKKNIEAKIGLDAKKLFEDLQLRESELNETVETFRRILANQEFSPKDLFPQCNELLTALEDSGVELAVATNKPTYLANQALEQTKISHFFKVVKGADALPPKPNPAILEYCLKQTGIHASESTMIGDRLEDMQAAKIANIRPIGITQGPHSKEDLLKNGAEKTFKSLAQLHNRMKRGCLVANLQ
jgi:phosphoglycolate phosphatase